ncbi:MAG: hypothetical protein K0V04_09645 [Deltaproteobacteria bacterium]|nr:hypothetical protein [Deltaproteobacteria bacterium]
MRAVVLGAMAVGALACGPAAVDDDPGPSFRLGDDQMVLENRQAVLDYLSGLSERSTNRILSGQLQAKKNGDTRLEAYPYDDPEGYMHRVFEHTGVYPGLMGVRYDAKGYIEPADITSSNDAIIEWWNEAGGLVMVGVGFANPEGNSKGEGVHDRLRSPEGSSVDVEQLLMTSPANAARSALRAQYAQVATGLQQLEDAGVVVIFKPYHEGSASHHFWWSHAAQEVHYIQLWRELHDYLTIERGLSNLIWEWCPHSQGSDPVWTADPDSPDNPALLTYPGADYVDIISLSWYASFVPGNSDPLYKLKAESRYLALQGLGQKPFDGKIFALGEAGPRRYSGTPTHDEPWDYRYLLSMVQQRFPAAAYWQSWNGRSALTEANDHTIDVMHDPRVVTLDEVDWRPRTGDQIALRSAGSYLSTLGNRHQKVQATTVTAAESLGVQRHGDGTVSFQVASIGKFISDYVLSDHRLRAHYDWNDGDPHRFDMVPAGHGRFALRSNVSGEYVSSPPGEYSRANEPDLSAADAFAVRQLGHVGDGDAVAVHTAANGLFVELDPAGTARNQAQRAHTAFIVVDQGNGAIGLRSVETGEFLATEVGGDELRVDCVDPSQDRCQFVLTFDAVGLATLQAKANNSYVAAPDGVGGALRADQITPGPTSQLSLVAVDAVLDDRTSILIDVDSGYYVTTTETGEEVVAEGALSQPPAELIMERSSPGRVAFRSPYHDGYLWVSDWANHRVRANRATDYNSQTRFDIVYIEAGIFALRSAYSGMFLGVSPSDGRIRANNPALEDAARFMAISVDDSVLPLP